MGLLNVTCDMTLHMTFAVPNDIQTDKITFQYSKFTLTV